jgi:hypothetical protein
LIPVAVKPCDGGTGQQFDFITNCTHIQVSFRGEALIISSLVCLHAYSKTTALDQLARHLPDLMANACTLHSSPPRATEPQSSAILSLRLYIITDHTSPYLLLHSSTQSREYCIISFNSAVTHHAPPVPRRILVLVTGHGAQCRMRNPSHPGQISLEGAKKAEFWKIPIVNAEIL